ncbi:osteoclast stimulatory transmembrane protein-like [Stegostoma tigrinum]|uniref:osteoclast stimulatory transmembrane protein-like n=1 Tax=Stegostoma tigrinum TaxID=3053191 RepID=UPI0028702E7C|nr:osteoclast stimulatory transmembrane protein-like [Stegostoma tigrinum]
MAMRPLTSISEVSIASAAGGLLYYWMSHTLQYKDALCGIAAGSLTSTIILLQFLVHPARCVFTLVIPTLGTKVGRKLLLTGICLLIAANVIPNIVQNIKLMRELPQCIMRSATENILNSTPVLSQATDVWKIKELNLIFPKQSLNLNHQIGHRHIENILTEVSQKINSEFHSIQLTHLEFDNGYLTRDLEKLAKSNPTNCDTFLAAAGMRTKTTGLKLSQKEMKKCLVHMAMITVCLALSAAVIADYGIFHLVSSLTKWTENVPCLSASLDVNIVIKWNIVLLVKIDQMVNVTREFPWNYTLVPTDCVRKPVPPDMQVIFFISAMYILAYFMAALDAYVVRIRRKIAASFFQKEEERIRYLYQMILKKYIKDGNAELLSSAEPSEGGAKERGWAEHEDGGFPQHLQGNGGSTQPGAESETIKIVSHETANVTFWNLEDSNEEETNLKN